MQISSYNTIILEFFDKSSATFLIQEKKNSSSAPEFPGSDEICSIPLRKAAKPWLSWALWHPRPDFSKHGLRLVMVSASSVEFLFFFFFYHSALSLIPQSFWSRCSSLAGDAVTVHASAIPNGSISYVIISSSVGLVKALSVGRRKSIWRFVAAQKYIFVLFTEKYRIKWGETIPTSMEPSARILLNVASSKELVMYEEATAAVFPVFHWYPTMFS